MTSPPSTFRREAWIRSWDGFDSVWLGSKYKWRRSDLVRIPLGLPRVSHVLIRKQYPPCNFSYFSRHLPAQPASVPPPAPPIALLVFPSGVPWSVLFLRLAVCPSPQLTTQPLLFVSKSATSHQPCSLPASPSAPPSAPPPPPASPAPPLFRVRRGCRDE